jgi:hypothetical protein
MVEQRDFAAPGRAEHVLKHRKPIRGKGRTIHHIFPGDLRGFGREERSLNAYKHQ